MSEYRDMVPELIEQCLTRPRSFAMFDDSREWFRPGGWGFSPIGTHRDAGTLERSNWIVVSGYLLGRFPECFAVIPTSHWAVGWFDHLAVDTSNEPAMLALAEWVANLADYPVADESHWSELEFTEACDAWENMSVAERVDMIQRHCRGASIFAARRDELPNDDSGDLIRCLTE